MKKAKKAKKATLEDDGVEIIDSGDDCNTAATMEEDRDSEEELGECQFTVYGRRGLT